MANVSTARRERIDGMAIFAAVGFGLGLALIYALERVGAPDAFVEALGPLLALIALSTIGATTRAANLPDFLAAGRAMPPLYGGLAFAANATGLAVALRSGGDAISWRGVAFGFILAALIVAPRWRRENASALSDMLATRFPARPTRVVFAAVLAAIGALTAIAGFDLATSALTPTFDFNPRAARALTIFALWISVAPGGLKGLVWSDAASAGAALLIGAIGGGLAATRSPMPFANLDEAWRQAFVVPSTSSQGLWAEAATALAVAFFFGLAAPAIGAGSARRARGAGLAGLAFAALGVALSTVGPRDPSRGAPTSHAAIALAEAAAWLPALALARAGAFGAARARGLDLATAYSALTVLASRRIALIRAGSLIVVALCPFVIDWAQLNAARAISLALALGLAFVTPSLLLALTLPASTASALAALATAFGVATARAVAAGALPANDDLIAVAGLAGTAGLVAGAVATMIFPRRVATARARADPFADAPT